MPDLKDLFDDAVAHPPAETHAPADVVRAARLDTSRRTTIALAGIAAAVIAVVGLGYGLSRDVSSAPLPGPAYQPPAGSTPLASAIPAEPRVDFLDQRTVESDDDRVQRFTALTNDGGAVLLRVVDGDWSFSVTGLGQPQQLAPPPGRVAGPGLVPWAVDSSWEVWGDPAARELELSVRDVASGAWFDVSGSLADLPDGASIEDVYLRRARLYVVASDPQARRAMLYDVGLRPGAVLEPTLPADAVVVGSGGSKVAWVPVATPGVVEVFDLDFDEPATLPLELAEGCAIAPRRSLATNSYLIAAFVRCDRGRSAVVRTFRWDGAAQEVLAGEGVQAIDMTEGGLVVAATDALYLLRPEARLVRRDGVTATDGLDAWAGAFIWDEAPVGSGPSRIVAMP